MGSCHLQAHSSVPAALPSLPLSADDAADVAARAPSPLTTLPARESPVPPVLLTAHF